MSTTPIITPSALNSKSLIDMMFMQQIMAIGSNMNSSGTLSLSFVAGFFFILCLEDIKPMLTDFITYLRTSIKEFHYREFVASAFSKCRRHQNAEKIFKPTLPNNSCSCQFEIDSNILINIINHKLAKKELDYMVNYSDVKFTAAGLKANTNNEQWNFIKFTDGPIRYSLSKPINVVYNTISGTIVTNVPLNITLETDEYRLISKEGFCPYGYRLGNKYSRVVRIYIIYETIADSYLKLKQYYERNLFQTPNKQHYPLSAYDRAFNTFICAYYNAITGKQISADTLNVLFGSNNIEGITFNDAINQSIDQLEALIRNKDLVAKYKFMIQMAELGYFVEWKKDDVGDLYRTEDLVPGYKFPTDATVVDKSPIKLHATSETVNEELIYNTFNAMLKSICSDAIKTVDKSKLTPQKTNFLSISHKVIKTDEPNPLYAEWLKDAAIAKEAAPPPPPKTIATTAESVEVVHKELGNCVKPIDTLYIAKSDMEALVASLEIFRDKKDLLTNLGLPNKYGLFLSGPPGTGKTSTIAAVATYLQKQIYYIGLNDVRTNAELCMLIEHVYAKSIEGGIIVFEDIDAMTDIVLSRDTTCDASHAVLHDNESLTLSYFLNVLDGVMSRDGMITIASSNHPEKLDAAFLREGRFDLHIRLGYADHYQIQKIYTNFFEKCIPEELLGKIEEYKYTPANFIFRFKNFVLRKGVPDEEILAPFLRSDGAVE